MLLKTFFVIMSFFIFWWLESGLKIEEISAIIKPLIFALSVSMTFSIKLRRYLLYISFLFYCLMIFLYLIWQISLANLAGSLGIGILAILIFSYFGDFVKRGFVEKL